MNRFMFLVFLCLPLNAFSLDYEGAFKLLTKHQAEIDNTFLEFPELDQHKVLATISPELIRYQLYRDLLETTALELAYVRFGKEQADFSIGLFQMKPSWAETLEAAFKQYEELANLSPVFAYQSTSNYKQRKERLNRLKSVDWQIRYACLFTKVIELQNAERCFNSYEAEIAFYATSYNYGIGKPASEIFNWMKIKAFPYGRKFKIEQVAFSEVALVFYHRSKTKH